MQVATEQNKQFAPAGQDIQISKHSHPENITFKNKELSYRERYETFKQWNKIK